MKVLMAHLIAARKKLSCRHGADSWLFERIVMRNDDERRERLEGTSTLQVPFELLSECTLLRDIFLLQFDDPCRPRRSDGLHLLGGGEGHTQLNAFCKTGLISALDRGDVQHISLPEGGYGFDGVSDEVEGQVL